jgi:hypothetical protein
LSAQEMVLAPPSDPLLPGVCGDGVVEDFFAASSEDDFVAELVECLREGRGQYRSRRR